jgi:NACHT domain
MAQVARALRRLGGWRTLTVLAALLAATTGIAALVGFHARLITAASGLLILLWLLQTLRVEILQPRQERAERSSVLRTYLDGVVRACEQLPYVALRGKTPPLSAIYMQQRSESDSREEPDRDGHRSSLEQAIGSEDNVVIEAGPGLGKTSLLNHLAQDLANAYEPGKAAQLLPVRVSAQALARKETLMARSLRDVVSADLRQALVDLPDDLFTRRPEPTSRWLLLIDALDEVVDVELRNALVRSINTLAEDPRSPYRFVVTTRPLLPRPDFSRESFACFRLQPFQPAQVEAFVNAWFAARDSDSGDAELFLERVGDSQLGDLATVPLLLTMAALVFERERALTLPSHRADLYERFVVLLLEDEEAERDTRQDFVRRWKQRHGREGADFADRLFSERRELLEHLALWAHEHDDPLLEEALRYVRGTTSVPDRIRRDGEWLSSEVDALLDRSSLLIWEGARRRFLHDTLREYLTASALARLEVEDAEEKAWELFKRWWQPGAREIVLFLLGIWSRDGRDLTELLQGISTAGTDELLFVGTAVAQGARVTPQLGDSLIDRLVDLSTRTDGTGLGVLGMFRGDPRVIHAVRGMTEDPQASHSLRLYAARTLGKLGLSDEGAAGLSRLARDATIQAFIRVRAASSLDDLGRTGEAVELLNLVGQELLPQLEGLQVAQELERLGRTNEATTLLPRYADEGASPPVRARAATLLAESGRIELAIPVVDALVRLAAEGQLETEDVLVGPLMLVGRTDDAVAMMLKVVRNPRVQPFLRWTTAEKLVKLGRDDDLVQSVDDRRVDAWVPALVGLAFWRAGRPDRSAQLLTDYARDATREPRPRVLCAEGLRLFVNYDAGETLIATLSEDPELAAAVGEHRYLIDRELGT